MFKTPKLMLSLVGLLLIIGLLPAYAQDGPIRGVVDLGGYGLYIDCQGEAVPGQPTVILETGLGGTGRSWLVVQSRIAGFAYVCSYDRAGMGGSDTSPNTERVPETLVAELHALLEAAEIPGPYVLVGWSWGGFYVRYFAYTYPDEVVGLVLVDTSHEDQFVRMADEAVGGEGIDTERAQWPQAEGITLANRDTLIEQMAATRPADDSPPLGSMPLILLTQGNPPEDAPFDYNVWLELQNDQATLSSNSLHIIAEDNSHAIPAENPRLVAEAIRLVIESAQTEAALETLDTKSVAELATSKEVEVPTQVETSVPMPVDDPMYPAGTAATMSGAGITVPLEAGPASALPARGICANGSTVTVLQTVAVDEEIWIEIDCMGSIGWVEPKSLTTE